MSIPQVVIYLRGANCDASADSSSRLKPARINFKLDGCWGSLPQQPYFSSSLVGWDNGAKTASSSLLLSLPRALPAVSRYRRAHARGAVAIGGMAFAVIFRVGYRI